MALDKTLQELRKSAITDSTRKSYDTGYSVYIRFLTLNNVVWDTHNMPPISEDYSLHFVAHCFEHLRIQLGTIRFYLCGIRYHYLWRGQNPLETPEGNILPRLNTVLQAIIKRQKIVTRPRLPITFELLVKTCNILPSLFSPHITSMLHAAFTTAFYAFLRCGEFTVMKTFDPEYNLCVEDVSLDKQRKSVTLTLKYSKTDPGRKGKIIVV